ncbi:MAG: PadR family transcriptional regulator [Gammaproteobacteria bacterium]|jgi:DNA-binding PadR family transcriptional regulator|nr:MAG: PadR family transcriptional regulator [Gammaproteobacteria bacterium]
MSEANLTEPEFLVLGLVAEMPRHGYQLAHEIEQRGMREWTEIGFSSIYFLLGKLEQKRFVRSKEPASEKAKKVFTITKAGRQALVKQTVASLKTCRCVSSNVRLGMLHLPVLTRDEVLDSLRARLDSVRAEMARMRDVQLERQPLPDYVEAVFDFSLSQLQAELEWVTRTLDYMRIKPWSN